MSSALAIAGTTLVLRNLLDNALIDVGASSVTGSKVKVTSLPPDTITIDGPSAESQLNLFLYQVTYNTGWRNEGLPSRDGSGRRLSNPPLALDLHYLVTAYGAEELHAEILLGYAMGVLHEHPVLDRDSVRNALSGGSLDVSILPAAFQALTLSDLADQVELLKVTPEPMDGEEASRLWSALQAHYRPSVSYQVSVVLIESRRPVRAAPPVLSRGPVDPILGRERGVVATAGLLPPFPTLHAVTPPNRQTAARLGETVVLDGMFLDGSDHRVRFEHARLDAPLEVIPASASATRVEVAIPSGDEAAASWAAGTWSVSVSVIRPGEAVARTSNTVAMQLAPTLRLGAGETSVERDPDTNEVVVHLRLRPQVRPGQRVALQLGAVEATGPAVAAPTDSLDFVFPELAAGEYRARVRVDGVDSVLVDRSVMPPAFDPTQVLAVPA